jgi:hypothetical protein
MMTLFKRLFAPLAAVLALASPASAKAPQARPALWQVSDADTSIYLFGTIHLLPENYQWRSSKFDAALNGSQELVVETIVDEKNPAAMMAALTSLAFSPNLPPLSERVPPAKRAALAAAVKKSGLPPQAFDRMETWAAAFMLLGIQFRDLGLKGGEGVETVLRSDFTAKSKPIGQLETNAEQLGFFDRLPEDAQRQLLEGALDSSDKAQAELKAMLASWVKGDVPAIARSFNRDLAGSPELYDALLKRRNANWAKWVENRLGKPGTVFVAVGAGHLAGKSSVIDLLQRDGLKVRRVQ